MSYPVDVLVLAKRLHNELMTFGVAEQKEVVKRPLYNEVITNKTLRKKTEKLFKDGHHAPVVSKCALNLPYSI